MRGRSQRNAHQDFRTSHSPKKRTPVNFLLPIKQICSHTRSFFTALLLGVLSLVCNPLQAQEQDPTFVHYFELEPSFNPAAVGRTDQLSINALFQNHATGYDNAGSTLYASADMAFLLGGLRHGGGVSFMTDQFGLFKFQRFSLQYAHHFRLLGGTFSLGAQAEMLQMTIEGSKADLESASDPAFPTTDMNGSRFDASAGIFYQRGNFYGGLSAIHLTAPLISVGDTYQYEVKPSYFFTAGYNIKMRNPLYQVVPSTLIAYDGTEINAILTGRLIYEQDKKRFYGGLSYNPTKSVALFVGGSFHGIELGYSYEAFTSGLGLASGQHEVTLRYNMDLHLTKKGKNRHKSVRWL